MAVTRERQILHPTVPDASLKRALPATSMESADAPNQNPDETPQRAGPGPKRKLPKMNASERAKYYRRRVLEYMEHLEVADSQLAREIEGLELLRAVQLQLLELCVPTHARRDVLAHVWAFMDAREYLRPHALSETQFEIRQVVARGDAQGVALQVDTLVRGVYAQDTVEKQLYPFVPGNARLLDKLLRTTITFASSFKFYFDGDGAIVDETTETDYTTGLLSALQCSPSEVRQLVLALGEATAAHPSPERRPRPSLDFLLDDEAQSP